MGLIPFLSPISIVKQILKYGPRKHLVLTQRQEHLWQGSAPLPRSRRPRRRSDQEARIEHVPPGLPRECRAHRLQEARLSAATTSLCSSLMVSPPCWLDVTNLEQTTADLPAVLLFQPLLFNTKFTAELRVFEFES